MEYMAPVSILIPKQRVGVLVGKKGEIKKRIEKEFGCRLEISSEGGVMLASRDALKLMQAKDVITAIARGFSPRTAMLLADARNALLVMHLADYAGKREKAILRHKSRLIGTKGKVRRNIEEATGAKISIYGKTVAIIGLPEDVELARKAIEKLISGVTHRVAYKFLDAKKGAKDKNDITKSGNSDE